MKTPAVLSVLLLLLLLESPACCEKPGSCKKYISCSATGNTGFTLKVTDKIRKTPPKTYSAQVKPCGNLIGGLTRLMYSSSDFRFSYIEDPDYGPYLQSVNGADGCLSDHTYWELLSKIGNCPLTPLSVGIGSYQPQAHEIILLNFTSY